MRIESFLELLHKNDVALLFYFSRLVMSAHKHNLQEVIYIIPQKLGFIQPPLLNN